MATGSTDQTKTLDQSRLPCELISSKKGDSAWMHGYSVHNVSISQLATIVLKICLSPRIARIRLGEERRNKEIRPLSQHQATGVIPLFLL